MDNKTPKNSNTNKGYNMGVSNRNIHKKINRINRKFSKKINKMNNRINKLEKLIKKNEKKGKILK